MKRKTSLFFSLGISAILIAATIWFLYKYNVSIWFDNGQWGMMDHNHMLGGGMGFVTVIFWIVLIGGIALLISGAVNGINERRQADSEKETSFAILKKRYARGEIDQEEYEDKRGDLRS